MARLLTYAGQVIDPTAYMLYIRCEVTNWATFRGF